MYVADVSFNIIAKVYRLPDVILLFENEFVQDNGGFRM